MSENRVRAYRRGLFAESIAALLLRLKGHRIITQRYKTPVGEIDLVALKGKQLAFVEMKQRKSFENAGWSLPFRARRRIVRAAQYCSQAIRTMPETTLPCSPRLGPGRVTSRMHFRFESAYKRAPWP